MMDTDVSNKPAVTMNSESYSNLGNLMTLKYDIYQKILSEQNDDEQKCQSSSPEPMDLVRNFPNKLGGAFSFHDHIKKNIKISKPVNCPFFRYFINFSLPHINF